MLMTKPFFVILIFLLIVVGLIYIYPDIRFRLEAGSQYKGIGFTGGPEELWYLARINGVYKGSVNLSDIYCYEHQNDPWFRPFFGELIVGKIGKYLGLSIVNLDIFMSAALNMILALLIFIFAYQLSGSYGLSILASFSVMLGYIVFSANTGILKAMFLTGSYSQPLWFLRPISPQFYYIPFFIALIFIHRAIYTALNKTNVLIAGALLGSLFYCNLYYWTFIYAGLAVLAAIMFIKKEKTGLKTVFFIYLISFIAAIPYFISTLKVMKHPGFDFLQASYMIFPSRKLFLYFPYFIPAAIAGVLLFVFKHRMRFFISAFLAGGLLCLNHQLVTGKNILQQWSFYSNKTFLIIAMIVAVQSTYSGWGAKNPLKRKSIKAILLTIALCFFIFVGFLQQERYYRANKELFLNKQNIAPAFNWLNQNGGKNDVVLTDPFLDHTCDLTNYRMLLTYTEKFSYIPETGCMLITEEEANYRVLSALLFLGYKEDDVAEYVMSIKRSFAAADKNIMIYSFPETFYEGLILKFKSLANMRALDAVKRYKVDYVLIENKKAEKTLSKSANGLKVVYKDENFTILKFN